MKSFFIKNNVIILGDYEFQRHRSTEQALLGIKNKIIPNFENKLYTVGIFLDLKKAFYTVQQEKILRKLQKFGICGVALTLIKSNLPDRYQFVTVNKRASSKIENTAWCSPWIHPTTFIISDIHKWFNNDTRSAGSNYVRWWLKHIFSGLTKQNVESTRNLYLLKLLQWLQMNKLQLDTNKTKYIIFKHNWIHKVKI